MFKHKILALVLLFAIAACKEDAPCHQGEEGLYLTSEWRTGIAPGEYIPPHPADSEIVHTVYQYDGNRHLLKIEYTYTADDSTRSEYTTTYQRDACGNVLQEDSPYGMTGIEQRTFTYNEAGQCIAIHYIDGDDTFVDSLIHSANGIRMKRYRNGTFTHIYSDYFIDSLTGNITRSTHGVASGQSYMTQYNYDDKPNPRKKMMLPFEDYNFPFDYSTNNIVVFRGVNDPVPYTYNEQGYPTSLGKRTFHYQNL